LSSEKKTKVANNVLLEVCGKSGIDSVSGNTGSRKFVNFMKMQQARSLPSEPQRSYIFQTAMQFYTLQCCIFVPHASHQEGNMNFENLNMGSNISDEFKKFCSHLVTSHAIDIAKQYQDRPKPSSKSSSTRTAIRRLDPCPICGRNSRGGNSLWCGQATDGLIFCMPGSTFNADPSGSMALGTVVNGFALMKRTPIAEGDCLIFGPDRPINPSRRTRRPQRTFRSRVDVKD
jgi:hypothetical protein